MLLKGIQKNLLRSCEALQPIKRVAERLRVERVLLQRLHLRPQGLHGVIAQDLCLPVSMFILHVTPNFRLFFGKL